MLGAIFLAGLVGVAAQGATPTVRPAGVAITLSVYDADGATPAVATSSFASDATAYAYTTGAPCQLHSPGPVAPESATFGWRVTERAIARAASEIVLQVQWARQWEQGHSVNGPSGSTDLTLHPGDRVSLDRIPPSASDASTCHGSLVLQIGFASGLERGGGVASNVAMASGTSAPMASQGFAVAGGGVSNLGSAAPNAGSPVAWTVTHTEAGMTVASNHGRIVMPSKFDRATLETINIDAWLVHGRPDGSEEAQHVIIDTTPLGGDLRFNPIEITTPAGTATVDVVGYIEAQRIGGAENLSVQFCRRITSSGPSSGGEWVTSATGKVLAMPNPGEVVSFDVGMVDALMQALAARTLSGNGLPRMAQDGSLLNTLTGHTFSLRVRINR